MNDIKNQLLAFIGSLVSLIIFIKIIDMTIISWTTFWINFLLFLSIVIIILLIYSCFKRKNIIEDNYIIINNRDELEDFFKRKNIDKSKFSDASFSILLKDENEEKTLGGIRIENYGKLTTSQVNFIFEKFRGIEDKGVYINGPIVSDWTNPKNDFAYWINPNYDENTRKFDLSQNKRRKFFGDAKPIIEIDPSDYPIVIKEGTLAKRKLEFSVNNILNSLESISQIIKNIK